jgi:hypothetical protein
MRLRLLLALLPLAAVAVFATAPHRATAGPQPVAENPDGTLEIPAAARAAGLRFAPTVAPGDQAWVLDAIAHARPEAQRLIRQVDGLVTVSTDLPDAGGGDITPMGLTTQRGAVFTVAVNIAKLDGERAIDRNVVVLHELGHVIDAALVPPRLDAQLDAGIPQGGSCGDSGGPFGGCAPPKERFADTFAKWSLGGAVSDVGAGYQIATPPSLETWGAPLGALAARLP